MDLVTHRHLGISRNMKNVPARLQLAHSTKRSKKHKPHEVYYEKVQKTAACGKEQPDW